MADRIQLRRDTKANWESYNPILLEGEPGHVLDDPNLYKMGDGVHAWNNLPYRGYTGTVVQTTGNAENAVMSQKAVTDRLSIIGSAFTIIPNASGVPNIDTVNRILDLNNCILCIRGNYWEMSQIWPNNPEYYREIPLKGGIMSSATKIVFNIETKRFYPIEFSQTLNANEVLIGGVRTVYGVTGGFVNAEFPFYYTVDGADIENFEGRISALDKKVDAVYPMSCYTGNNNVFVWGNKIYNAIPGRKYNINILTPDVDMSGVTRTDSVMRLSALFTKKDGTYIDQEIVPLRTGGEITPLKSKYSITIPDDTIYFQVGGRCTLGQEFKTTISENLGDNDFSLNYYGAPIRIAQNKYERPLYKSFSPSYWHQSMAIYNDYAVFMIYGYGTDGSVSANSLTMHIYSISSGTKLASIDVPYGNYTIPHCNTSVFGKEFASENSIAPLLYVSQWNGERNCLVYDITLTNDVYSVELKQVIGTNGISQNIEGIGMRDWVIDTDNNVMYSIAYYLNSDAQVEGNKTMFVKFPLPSLSDGNVTYGESDILDHFEFEFFKFFQDKCYNGGKIYIASGMGNYQSITNLRVVDLNIKKIVTLIPLGDTYNSEPEGLDVYKDKLLMTYGSMSLFSIETE